MDESKAGRGSLFLSFFFLNAGEIKGYLPM